MRKLAVITSRALKALHGLIRAGRGGARNRGPQSKRDLIRDLAILYENVTKRRPGVSYRRSGSKYSGPFVRFAILNFKALGLTINGHQVYRLLQAVRIENKIE